MRALPLVVATLAMSSPSLVARAQAVPSLILGRPTDSSITVNALGDLGDLYFEYGTAQGTYSSSTTAVSLAGDPVEVVIEGLDPDTQYYYRSEYQPEGGNGYEPGPEHSFRTQRAPGSSFVFTIQADSHQGFFFFHDPDLYEIMFGNVLADGPDFHVDLGDAFSLDGNAETVDTVRQKYLAQREAFALVGHSAAIFLVLGNHENEEGWNLDDQPDPADTLPVMGANARKRYFANPVPDGFYTGNTDASITAIDGDHLKQDYYAFEWGDALFVAIDPYWYTVTKPFAGSTGGEQNDEVVGDRWDWTLGQEQYEWLRTTLEQSDALFKFVFAHHLAGGTVDYSRGGALGAPYCEWGGYATDGSGWEFDVRRPSFVTPIHDLLVANGVTIFFHGHDHVFVTEELDGVVYQECPHAANASYGTGFASNASDYAGSVLVENSGHVRVSVSPDAVVVDYIRAFLPGDGDNGQIGASYTRYAPAPNAKPVAVDDSTSTDAGAPIAIDVLENDSDEDGDALTIVGVSQPALGTTVNRGTDVFYVPATGYCDDDTPDTFRYSIMDGRGGSHTATVQVIVQCECSDDDGCDDGDACTVGSCDAGFCEYEQTDCDDADACTVDACAAATGCSHTLASCADDDACTVEGCDPAVGCVYPPRSCDDSVACTIDSCDPAGGCLNAPSDAACDDADPCTVDTCTLTGCTHADVVCDDDDACTSDACVEGSCLHVEMDCGTDLCFASACDSNTGLCGGAPLDCDDEDPCTIDGCDPAVGCSHVELDCDQGDPCAPASCDPATGECVVAPIDCDDENPCTDDSCDGQDGSCIHSPNDDSCDDGEPCTQQDRCREGQCLGFTLDCTTLDDACHVGACDGLDPVGCTAIELADGTSCEGDGACTAGACEHPGDASAPLEPATADAGMPDAGGGARGANDRGDDASLPRTRDGGATGADGGGLEGGDDAAIRGPAPKGSDGADAGSDSGASLEGTQTTLDGDAATEARPIERGASGCGCRVPGRAPKPRPWLWMAGPWLLVLRRRVRRRGRGRHS